MAEDTQQALEDLVRPLFRSDAMVKTVENEGGCLISASWRLGSHRMDNWSREIQILIPREVTARFAKLNDKGRSKAKRQPGLLRQTEALRFSSRT